MALLEEAYHQGWALRVQNTHSHFLCFSSQFQEESCQRVTVGVMKYYNQRNVRRKGFVCLTFLTHCSSFKEVGTGTQTGQKPGDRS